MANGHAINIANVMTFLMCIINLSSIYANAGLCSSLLLPLGYPCTEYQVTTEDGYILGVQRVWKGISPPDNNNNNNNNNNNAASRPPIFLQHGLFQGGDTWFLNPPDESLGFLLANEGFDVWVGNNRGTNWSYGHTSFSNQSKEFWDWSWEELAMYDIPAMVGLVYNVTGSKVFYVGHSQGTIIAFAAFTDAKVSEMIAASALLSPISYLGHATSPVALVMTKLYIDKVLQNLGIYEFNLRSDSLNDIAGVICSSDDVDCGQLLTFITGPNCCFNESRVSYYLDYEPHSSSTKNLAHLMQMIRKGTFERYDYGWIENLRRYSQLSPPSFYLSDIPETIPLWMAYGGKDALADPQDVMLTLQELNHRPKTLYLDNYAHLDFVSSFNAATDIYSDLIAFFKSQSRYSLM